LPTDLPTTKEQPSLEIIAKPPKIARPDTWWVALIAFIAQLPILGFSLHQPPVWDGAMSVYPAAIELANSGFDLPEVLALPTYLEGGPNTHTLSPLTMLVALLIVSTGSLTSAVPILHVMSLALSALTGAAVYRLISRKAPQSIAIFGALAVLLFPPMVVQTADVYLDLPLACLGTWSFVGIVERRPWFTTVLVTAAVWMKPLAMIFVGVMALHWLFFGSGAKRTLRAVAPIVIPTVTAVLVSLPQFARASPISIADRYSVTLEASSRLLLSLPDMAALVLATLLLTAFYLRSTTRSEELMIAGFVLISGFVFILINPLVTHGIPFLPRYYVMIVPALVIGVLLAITQVSRRIALIAGIILSLVFALNLYGAFYPFKGHASFALAERSLAYRDLLQLQRQDISLLASLASEMPIYFDYFAYFRLAYPEMGYASVQPDSAVSVFHDPRLFSATLADLPPRFGLLFEYPVLGGEVLERLWSEARAVGAIANETKLTKGSYSVYVIEVVQAR
jgi:hypothetical protein